MGLDVDGMSHYLYTQGEDQMIETTSCHYEMVDRSQCMSVADYLKLLDRAMGRV